VEPVIIRQAQVDDCDDMLWMLSQLTADLGDSKKFLCSDDDLRNFGFTRHSLFKGLIARRGHERMGIAIYFPLFSTLRGKPGVYLQDLWVSPEGRNLGLGKRMIEQVVIEASQQWQAVYLHLTVHGHNESADRFYRRFGFTDNFDENHLCLEGDAFQAFIP